MRLTHLVDLTRVNARFPRRQTILLVTRILLGAQGALWIVLTAILVFRRDRASAMSAPVVVPLLMAMNAAVFLGASFVLLLILRHNRQ
jgi:membrane associated rhomboid family serine protease